MAQTVSKISHIQLPYFDNISPIPSNLSTINIAIIARRMNDIAQVMNVFAFLPFLKRKHPHRPAEDTIRGRKNVENPVILIELLTVANGKNIEPKTSLYAGSTYRELNAEFRISSHPKKIAINTAGAIIRDMTAVLRNFSILDAGSIKNVLPSFCEVALAYAEIG